MKQTKIRIASCDRIFEYSLPDYECCGWGLGMDSEATPLKDILTSVSEREAWNKSWTLSQRGGILRAKLLGYEIFFEDSPKYKTVNETGECSLLIIGNKNLKIGENDTESDK